MQQEEREQPWHPALLRQEPPSWNRATASPARPTATKQPAGEQGRGQKYLGMSAREAPGRSPPAAPHPGRSRCSDGQGCACPLPAPGTPPLPARPPSSPCSAPLPFSSPLGSQQGWAALGAPRGAPRPSPRSPLPGSAFGRSLPGQQESLPLEPGSPQRCCCFSLCLPPGYGCLKQGLGKSSGFYSPWRDLNSIP